MDDPVQKKIDKWSIAPSDERIQSIYRATFDTDVGRKVLADLLTNFGAFPISGDSGDLKAGDVIDGIGGFHCYGMIENTNVAQRENLLLMGLAEGCRIKSDIPKDRAITFDNVECPQGRLCDKLWKEQNEHFFS